MLRKIAPLLMLCLLLTLFACGQPAPESEPVSPATGILGKWYAYDESCYPDEYAPVLTFNADGTFHFLVNLLEGMGSMTGTYEVRDGVIKCAVADKDFLGFRGDDITSFELSVSRSTLVYHGAAFGANEAETGFVRKKA